MGRDGVKVSRKVGIISGHKDILLEEAEAHYKSMVALQRHVSQSCATLPNLTSPALFFHLQNGKQVSFQFKFLSLCNIM